MLTQHDINMMKGTVMDILGSWGMTATILTPKPEDEQPNWNPLMREFTGDIEYNTIENVPVERLEVVNEYHQDRTHMKAGTKTESSILYKFPAEFNGSPLVITSDMLFMFNGDNTKKYHINTIRERIGETIVDVDLIIGNASSEVMNHA